MKANMGNTERYVRLGLGVLVGIVAWRMRKASALRSLLGLASVSGIESGLTKHCAVKEMMGWGDEIAKAQYDASAYDNKAIPSSSQAI
jgi:Protein of unknown function (DUF2892)